MKITAKPKLLSAACLAILAFSAPAAAQPVNYFPLQVGNSWLFRPVNSSPAAAESFRTVSVDARESINGQEYFRVKYFNRESLLRALPDGSLVRLNQQSGQEVPFLSLNAPEGASFPASVDDCVDSGTIASRNTEVKTPAGNFQSVLVRYRTTCADAGITAEAFAANTGPVRHEETSFAGPNIFELVYFRAGDRTAAHPEISFNVALDGYRYPVGAQLNARLTLRSTLSEQVRLNFQSGQLYELKLLNERGEIVYTWSASRLFPAIVIDLQFGPGEKTYLVQAPLSNLPPGRYRVQAYLTTQPLLYSGEAAFEIVQ